MNPDEEYGVQEGDMMLQRDRNAASDVWPEVDGQVFVPYEINPELGKRASLITQAFKMISEKTCVKFRLHTDEADYLHFKEGPGCASLVGLTGGEQPLLISKSCTAGNICHEILHALGFYHEHSRKDRNEYITIQYDNISPGREDNFEVRYGKTLGMAYDRGSIMHYGEDYFSRNGKPTIVTKDGNVKIGQRTHLSDLDVERIRKLYHCKGNEEEGTAQVDYGDYEMGLEGLWGFKFSTMAL
ncbi:hypothetical protein DNTS_030114 [Danionella cerebrum]|uniref:Metalloendopeptidase n=1 Tax=Danionella cerebrum TaxID=2873325 RepID=A0A553Q1S2_9TELE|nr:hypothetical protein DNTS_030114 [Danionella translucida]